MKRFAVLGVAAIAVMGLFAQSALAAEPHLKGRNPIAFTDNGLDLTARVSYAGLGNFDSLQVLTATGGTVSTCTNQGGNQAPGQNPAPVTLVGATPIEADDIKNGNVTISSRTDPPVTPVPGAPGCANSNWTEDITDVAFTSATIQLFQDQTPADGDFGRWETLVLTANCTFDPATSNGSVPASGFTCTEV
ncbi:MAG TPA: hypothetical protein VFH36_20085 [Acidimicrobiales bacterium]|nr:hypothetical protein [Acidimicrobiales bacterium]